MNYNHNLAEVLQTIAATLSEVASHLEMTTSSPSPQTTNGPVIHAPPIPRLTTPWPRLGRTNPTRSLQMTVDHPQFQRNFRQGQTVVLYAAGCSALSRLAIQSQLPLFKLGTTQKQDLLVRQEELRIDRYGSAVKTSTGYVDEGGWADWEMRQLQAVLTLSAACPIHYTSRALLITLPQTLPFRQFEKELQLTLEEISLTAWSMTPVGRQHFATLGIDPSLVQRYTGYEYGSRERHMRAKEIYICRPRTDIADIADRIEQMIVAHVLAQTQAVKRAAA